MSTTENSPSPGAAQPLQLLRPNDYRAGRIAIFPSSESFRWFVRQNRNELVQAGALMCPTGSWLVQPDAFDRAVMNIGVRRAAHRGFA